MSLSGPSGKFHRKLRLLLGVKRLVVVVGFLNPQMITSRANTARGIFTTYLLPRNIGTCGHNKFVQSDPSVHFKTAKSQYAFTNQKEEGKHGPNFLPCRN